MSKDIIYREDAIKALDVSIYKDDIEDAINAMPSADRPQGEWEERPSEDWISIRRWYCSECGEWQTYGMTNYCPNCGAKMKGAEDDNA